MQSILTRTAAVLWLLAAASALCAPPALANNAAWEAAASPVTAQDNHLTLQQIITLVYGDLDQFWSAQFTAEGLTYASPHEFRAYTANDPTPCGLLEPNNAVYCTWVSEGLLYHAIYYDLRFLQRVLNGNGDSAVVAIFAHEWGHLVQNLLGVFIGTQTILKELQADCLTGVYSHSAQQRAIMDAKDLDEMLAILYKMGDDLPLLHPDAHGSPEMRRSAFSNGYLDGLPGCSFERVSQLIEAGPSGPPPAPPPGNSATLGALDRDGNCTLSDGEFFAGVDLWIAQSISDALFFAAVDAWIGQMPICNALGLKAPSESPGITLTQHGTRLIFESGPVDGLEIEELEVAVFNNAGELVFQQQFWGNSARIVLEAAKKNLANGVYWVRVLALHPDGSIETKLIKIMLLR